MPVKNNFKNSNHLFRSRVWELKKAPPGSSASLGPWQPDAGWGWGLQASSLACLARGLGSLTQLEGSSLAHGQPQAVSPGGSPSRWQPLQVAAPGSSRHDDKRLLEPVSKRDHKGCVTLSNSALEVIQLHFHLVLFLEAATEAHPHSGGGTMDCPLWKDLGMYF